MARATRSSLKHQRSSSEPPPRATMQHIAILAARRGCRWRARSRERPPRPGPPWDRCARCAAGNRARSTLNMSCMAAPVGEVTTPMRRGTAGSGALALRGEQPFRGEPGLELLELALERAFAGFLEMLDDELVFAARLVQAHARAGHHQHSLLGPESQQGIALPPHGAAHLGLGVLEREIPMAGGGRGEIRQFPFQPEHGQAGFKQQPHLFIEA